MSQKYTAEEVRAIARRLHDYIMVTDRDTSTASDMLDAYAERIKADEVAADYPECSGDPSSCPENEGHGCCKPNPPAQAAQVDDWRIGMFDRWRKAAQEKGAVFGYVYQSPDEDPVFEYAADRWSPGLRYGTYTETPVYTAQPAQPAERVPEAKTEMDYEYDEEGLIDTYCTGHMDGWNDCRKTTLAAAPSVPAESVQPTDSGRMAVGMAGTMPGTDVFTVAFFKASDVPAGTELYTHPATPARVPEEWGPDDAWPRLELWFFRDLKSSQRLALFALHGLPVDEIGESFINQKRMLRRLLAAAPSAPQGESHE